MNFESPTDYAARNERLELATEIQLAQNRIIALTKAIMLMREEPGEDSLNTMLIEENEKFYALMKRVERG